MDKRHRRAWAYALGPILNAAQSGYFGVTELMRLHSDGLTVKERVYVQERLDTISEAIGELRIITKRTKATCD